MTTVHATYKDGVLYPLTNIKPEDLKKKILRVVIVEDEPSLEDAQKRLRNIFASLKTSNPFKNVSDIVEWQREERKDRDIFS